MTFKDQIIALHRQHPTWNTEQIKRAVGCSMALVSYARVHCGLPIPWALVGRRHRYHRGGLTAGLLSAGA